VGESLPGPSQHRAFPPSFSVYFPIFREIVFLDHKECGAFQKFYPDLTPENEEEYHRKHMQMAHDNLANIFPSFKFRGFLMDTDGSVKELLIEEKVRVDPKMVREDNFLLSLKH
jgi:hypothetical protein